MVDKVKEDIEKFDLDDEFIVELNGELDTVNQNLKSSKPSIDVIGPPLRSAKNILEGSAGSVLASNYAAQISTFLNFF